MSRPAKKFSDPKKQRAHNERLAKRRERQHEKRTMKLAAQAAEGSSDFEALVEAEKQRMETAAQTNARKGGSQTPKINAAARESLAKAFDLMGGVAGLVVWGRANPTEFYRIWARLIPKESEAAAQLPLETLLSKLAEKEELSVAEAAMQIGRETMEAAREQVRIEDALTVPDGESIN